MAAHVQVQFTIDDVGRGAQIAEDLLQRRLVACVQEVGPITSRYWWEGRLEQATEHLYLCKAPAANVDRSTAAIRAAHPYDVPEVVVLELAGRLPAYLGWIYEVTAEGGGQVD